MSLNSVNVMGNLTRDPELKSMPSGTNVCRLSIANNRIYVKNGEKVTEVSYFDVDVWGKVADNCAKYLKKGNGIIVEGRLRQDRWEKDGKTQSKVSITANNIHFMPKTNRDEGAGTRSRSDNEGGAPVASPDDIAWEE
jgi:single-strand DNA-binding protein